MEHKKEPSFEELIKDPNRMGQWLLDIQDKMIERTSKALDDRDLTLKERLRAMKTLDKMIRTRQMIERDLKRSTERRKSKYDKWYVP